MERYGVVARVGKGRRVVDAFGDRAAMTGEVEQAEGTWVTVDGGAVTGTLAEAGSGLAELYAIAAKAGLSPLHSDEARAEAAALAASPGIDDATLVDLTHLPLVTIDEVSSRDLDQAVCIERDRDGFVVWYALADASWYVRPGMALYREAVERGSSYYLPGLVLPMLPKVLSEDVVSLNAGVDRRAMVFELRLDAEGRAVERRIHRARVHSRHKLAFDWVQAFLEGGEVDWDADVQASLRLLPEVGERRIVLAEERNVVRYRRAEVEVRLEGLRFVALDEPRNDVERYNEQISLLTNIEGARFLLEGDTEDDAVEPIYRVHEAPGDERFEELRRATIEIARLHGLDPDLWVWRPEREGLNAYLDRLPHDYVGQAIHRQAMIANRPSHFASMPGLHYGVGADVYGRFTAPMREIVGIFLHNEAWEKIAGHALVPEALTRGLRQRVIDASNEARERQRQFDRDANRLVLDHLFEGQDARTYPATVLGITATRIHVQLDSPKIDVKVYVPHVERAWGDSLVLAPGGAGLLDAAGRCRLRLGDRVQVHVVRRDTKRDRWELALDPLSPDRQLSDDR
ncbi:MAG: RNB domain-containing ribonuclease [Alphaproteobacteria bacterium]|nr:RNB domain-containing ribonuclease [Alphaproteobacteria bacterium]